MKIVYLKHIEINKGKWDKCISESQNPLLYCTSDYLDILAGQWDALVINDYEIVIPIIYKKKYGINYCYQPAYLPQINIFSAKIITEILLIKILEKLFSIFSFAEISFAYPTSIPIFDKNIQIKKQQNFILYLNTNYENLYKNYSPNFTKSLRRLQKHNLQYSVSDDINETFKIFTKNYLGKIKSVKANDICSFKKLCTLLLIQKSCIINQVKDAAGNILAIAILLKYKNRLYNMLSCVSTDGKKLEANYFLYDKIIQSNCNQNIILDFEGSDIKGIANFYKKMNPINEPNTFVKYNNLPLIIKIFKK